MARKKVSDIEATRKTIINGVKAGFEQFSLDFGAFTTKAQFSQPFTQAFLDWQDTFDADTAKEVKSQVAFVRAIAPDLPKDRGEYRVDPRYMAAQYLFRKGLETLKKIAKKAVDDKTATPQQARLATIKPKRSIRAGKENKIVGVKIGINTILEAIAMCDITPDQLRAALKAVKLPDDQAVAMEEAYKDVVKRIAEEV